MIINELNNVVKLYTYLNYGWYFIFDWIVEF